MQEITSNAIRQQISNIESKFFKIFRIFINRIQFILIFKEFIDFIISVRFSYFNFTRYESHEFINPVMPQAIGIEPAIKIRIGGEFLKLKFQLGYNLINSIKGPDFNYDRGFGLVGLECSF